LLETTGIKGLVTHRRTDVFGDHAQDSAGDLGLANILTAPVFIEQIQLDQTTDEQRDNGGER
jgi:hypothetical protein